MDVVIAFVAGGLFGFAVTVLYALCVVQKDRE